MKPDLEERALSIVLQLSEAPQDERDGLRSRLCGEDPQLKSAVADLWQIHQGVERKDFWQRPVTLSPDSPGDSAAAVKATDASEADRLKRPPKLERFIPIDILGLGGQGEVWLMLDPRIDRRVALKIAQPSQKGSKATLSSFRREAELNGKLEHPNIVPVYDITAELSESGEADPNSPCFVMRVFGDPRLHVAIEAYHQRSRKESDRGLLDAVRAFDRKQSQENRETLERELAGFSVEEEQPADAALKSAIESILRDDSEAGTLTKAINRLHTGEWSELQFRKLLGRFQRVCEGVAYAHSRNVIHRDLKPDNIMLGEYGETLVADWGLAKVIGQKEEPQGERSDVALEVNSDDVDSTKTRQGNLKGTPRYMSPEQAQGLIDALGPPTDIYSLGAVLYRLVAGTDAIKGNGLKEILRKVREGDFLRPSEVQPRTPKGLEAIILKAISLRPEDRYPTALALSADIECWLNDEPISAWQEPLLVRGRRWIRRHQTMVTTAVAAVAVAIVSLGVGLVIVSTQNNLLDAQKRVLETQKQVLETSNRNLELAKQDADGQRNRALKGERDLGVQLVNNKLALGTTLVRQNSLLEGNVAFAAAYHVAKDRPEIPEKERELLSQLSGITESLLPRIDQHLFGDGVLFDAQFDAIGDHVAVLQTTRGTIRIFNARTGMPTPNTLKHDGPTYGFAFTPDGKHINSWAMDRIGDSMIYRWNVESGKKTGPAKAQGRIKKLTCNHDGTILAMCYAVQGFGGLLGESGRIEFRNSETLELLGEAIDLSHPVSSVAFSPDGSLLAATVHGAESPVQVYKVVDHSLLCKGGELSDHSLCDIVFSPDGTKLAVASNTGAFQVLNGQTGVAITPPLIHPVESENATDDYGRPLGFVSFSPDGQTVLTACGDRTARMWSASTGLPTGKIMEHEGPVTSCRFSADGSLVGTSCLDGTARIWNAITGRPTAAKLRHLGPIYSLRFSPNGKQILTASEDRTARIWSYQPPRPLAPEEMATLPHTEISDDGRWLAGAKGDGSFQAWDAGNMTPVGPAFKCEHPTHLMRFAPNKTLLAFGGFSPDNGGQISVFDFATGQAVGVTNSVNGLPLKLLFSADSRWCAILTSTAKGKILTIRDLQENRQSDIELTEPDQTEPDQMVWNPVVASELFVGCRDGLVFRVSLPDGTVAETGIGNSGVVIRHLDISSDGQLLATTTGNEVQVWTTSDSKPVYQALRHSSEPNGATFFADSKRLLTWGNDGIVKLWERDPAQSRWNEVRQFFHDRPVNDAAFSPDGLLVASASDDQTAQVWDVNSSFPVSPPLIHNVPAIGSVAVQRVQFSRDSRTLFSASENMPALLEQLPMEVIKQNLKDDPRSMDSTTRQLMMQTVTQVWQWQLKPKERGSPVALQLAEFAAGKRLDEFGRLLPIGTKDMLELFEKIAEILPNAWTFRQMSGRLARESGNLEEAERQFSLALKQEQNNGLLWYEYGLVLHDLDRYKDAWEAADRAIACGNGDSRTYLLRGRSARYLDRFEEAIVDLKKAIETSLVPQYARLDLANCQAMLGQFEAAAESFDLSFNEHRSFGDAVEASDRYRRIVLELARNNPAEYQKLTQQFLKSSAKTDDTMTAYHVVLAAVLQSDSVEDWSQVLELAQKAADAAPQSSEDQAILGYAQYRAGQPTVAERQLRPSIALQKPLAADVQAPSPLPHYFLALVLHTQGKSDQAKASLATANQLFDMLKTGPKDIALSVRLPWQRRVAFETLQKEAEGKLGP